MVKHYGTRVKRMYPIGTVYGRLTIYDYERRGDGCWSVLCRCSCGNIKIVQRPNQMRRGLVRSCGCLNSELSSKRRKGKAPVGKLPEGEAAFNALLRIYTTNAAFRGLEFNLQAEKFRILTSSDCFYCGIPPFARLYRHRNGTYAYNGLDRVDPVRGYTEQNVVPCCIICNRAKRSMTHDEFMGWLNRVFVHQQFKRT